MDDVSDVMLDAPHSPVSPTGQLSNTQSAPRDMRPGRESERTPPRSETPLQRRKRADQQRKRGGRRGRSPIQSESDRQAIVFADRDALRDSVEKERAVAMELKKIEAAQKKRDIMNKVGSWVGASKERGGERDRGGGRHVQTNRVVYERRLPNAINALPRPTTITQISIRKEKEQQERARMEAIRQDRLALAESQRQVSLERE